MTGNRGEAPTPPSAGVGNGPAVSRQEFDALFAAVRTWDRWTPADRGAWNRVTPDHVRRATALARSGTVVPLARPWNTAAGPDNSKPALHYMSDLGDVEAPEPSTHKDFIAVDYHGKATSHLDALSHAAYRGQLYDGRTAREYIDAGGARFGAVSALGPLVTRGVLLDLPTVLGCPWLEPGRAVHAGDIVTAERALGVTIGEGDAVLLRSGSVRRRREEGAWDPGTASAGFHVDAVPLLAERGSPCSAATATATYGPHRSRGCIRRSTRSPSPRWGCRSWTTSTSKHSPPPARWRAAMSSSSWWLR